MTAVRMLLQKGAGMYTTLINVIEECNNYDYHRITLMLILAHVFTDPNKKTSYGDNALHLVCKRSSGVDITEVVKLLIDRYYCTFIYNFIYITCSYVYNVHPPKLHREILAYFLPAKNGSLENFRLYALS